MSGEQFWADDISRQASSLSDLYEKIPRLPEEVKESEEAVLDTMSIIPQASVMGDDNDSLADVERLARPEEDTLDSMINKICDSYLNGTQYDFLIDEKLDEKHAYLVPGSSSSGRNPAH